MPHPTWRFIVIQMSWAEMRRIGVWRVLYGCDVFFNSVPVGKLLIGLCLLWRLL